MAPARPISDLDCDEPFHSAASKVIWTRFEEMMAFRDAIHDEPSIDDIHDMRVSSRRLRAALEGFADVFPRRGFQGFLRQIKDLADALGEVRDRDVMIQELEHDMKGRASSERQALAEMIEDLSAERDRGLTALKTTLTRMEATNFSRRFLSFVIKETM